MGDHESAELGAHARMDVQVEWDPAGGRASVMVTVGCRVCQTVVSQTLVELPELVRDAIGHAGSIEHHRAVWALPPHEPERVPPAPEVCLGRDMDCGRALPCPDHPAAVPAGTQQWCTWCQSPGPEHAPGCPVMAHRKVCGHPECGA